MSNFERGQFTFYRSFYEAASVLPDRDKLRWFMALCEYGLFSVEPDFDPDRDYQLYAMFSLVRPNLDSARRKAFLGKCGGEHGGAPKENQNARKENTFTEKQSKIEKEVEVEKEVKNEIEKDNKKEAPPKLCFGEKVIEEETEKEKKAAAVLGFDPFAIARNALYGDRSVPSSPETDMETRKQEQIAAVLGWRS